MRYVYIVRCADGTLYTGITTDRERRVHEHNNDTRGSKYTKTRRPVHLVWSQSFPTRKEASQQEYQIKQLSKQQKEQLIFGANTT